jgi:N-methylhydantoinase B
MSSPDPITVSVIQHRLVGIVDEMGEAMLRTSYSQILNSSRDFSTALCDAQARLVAQAEHIPVHVGALPYAVQAVQQTFGDDVHPGDVFLLNDPYHGGSHLPDLTAFVPVFGDGRLRFWSVNRAHQSDIGGATHGAYNAAATEIWQEGLRIPPMRIHERGRVREDVMAMLALNVRHPFEFNGDLAAQVGSVHLAERRLQRLMQEFSADVVDAAVERILDASETQARAIFESWPDGTYHGQALMDDDGRGHEDITIRAAVTIAGSDLTIDLSTSDDEVDSFINSSYANMRSAVAMAMAYLLDADIARNHGSQRPVTVVAREGSVVWAREGAPVTFCTSHCAQDIIEAIVDALAPACPERAMASWGKRYRIALKGVNPDTGRGFIWHLFHARTGGGASSGGDGWHCAGEWHVVGGLKFGSVEVAEARFPLFFEEHELRPGSGGDGEFVGGTGGTLRLRVDTDGDCVANTAGEGARHGAPGRNGGQPGARHRYLLQAPGEAPRLLPSKREGIPVPAGSVFSVFAGGGGGWGDPTRRDAAARARDRLDDLIDPSAAEMETHR